MFSPAYESGNEDDQEPDIVGANESIVYEEGEEDVHVSGGTKGRGSKLPPKGSKRKSQQPDRTRSD